MIRRVPAYVDSEGVFHPSREAACKAEFRRLLQDTFHDRLIEVEGGHNVGHAINVDDLVEALFDLDRIVGDAQKEDTRYESAQPKEPSDG